MHQTLFAAPLAQQSLPIKQSAMARAEPDRGQEQEISFAQSEGNFRVGDAMPSTLNVVSDAHSADTECKIKQVISPPMRITVIRHICL